MAQILYMDSASSRSFFNGASLAFGVFDGVHRGHRYLMSCARETALHTGGKSVVLTFSIDPDELFAKDRLIKLLSNEERIKTLASCDVDYVAVLPFDREFASLSPEAFLSWTFGDSTPSHIHVGKGFRFGCRASGTVDVLRCWGDTVGATVCDHELLEYNGIPISATRIRGLLSEHKVHQAETLLGRSWKQAGMIAC